MFIKPQLLEIVSDVLSTTLGCDSIKPSDPQKLDSAKKEMELLGKNRGRPLLYPMIPTGRGSGPFVEIIDGSVKLDLITGIGVHLFGHGHPELILQGVKAALKCPTMQGTLMPGREYAKLSSLLLEGAQGYAHLPNEARSQVNGCWLTSCGTMANEYALKILRQKKSPAYRLITFNNAFSGRSTAMQEMTDEPKYREGQPTFDQFSHIPFFNPKKDLNENIKDTCSQIDALLAKHPNEYCGLGFELIQGEGGGFSTAPREWWTSILSHAKSQGLGIWFDEVQTFGRTGELFAFQRYGLGEYVDVVSAAKPLQCGAVLWTADYAPKTGLIAGTFAGGTVPLALGASILEMLKSGNYFGPQGRIRQFEEFVQKDWTDRKKRIGEKYNFSDIRITGGMIAVDLLDGKAETIKKFLDKLFSNGVIGFSAGKNPTCVRFLPPMGVITTEQWTLAMSIFEKTLEEFSEGK